MHSFFGRFILAATFLIAFTAQGQTPAGLQIYTSPVLSFGGGDQAADGSFYLAGNETSGIQVIRTGEDRQVIFNRKITGTGTLRVSDVEALVDGCAVLGNTAAGGMAIIRLDAAGQVLWAQTYPTAGSIITNTIEANPAGELLVSCFNNSGGSVVLKTTAAGAVLWSRGLVGGIDNQVRSATFTRSGQVLVTGNFNSDLYIARLNASGDQVNAVTFNRSGAEAGLFVRELSNGDVAMAGYDFTGNRFGYIMRLDATLNVRWASTSNANQVYFLNVVEAPNGHLQVSGDNSTSRASMFMIDFDAAGNVQTARQLNGSASASSFEGRGKSHFFDRQGNVHLLGQGATPGGLAGAYWTVLDPALSLGSCDVANLTATRNPLSLTPNTPGALFTNLSLTGSALTVTSTPDNGCGYATCTGLQPVQPVNIGADRRFCEGAEPFPAVLTANIPGTYLWSTGATTAQITVNAPGAYWVQVTSACGQSSDTVRFTRQALPTITLDSLGPLRFCPEGSVRLTAAVSDSVAGFVWNTGQSDTAITVDTTGIYFATATGINGCVGRSDTLRVRELPAPPEPVIFSDRLFPILCEGDSIRLSVSNFTAFDSVRWSNGSRDSVLIVRTAGVYALTGYNAFGCQRAAMPVNVTVNPLPPRVRVLVGGPLSFCPGGAVALGHSFAGLGNTIRWNTGSADSVLVATGTSGAYFLSVTTAAGCSTVSDTVQVTVWPTPPAPVLEPAGPLNLCLGLTADIWVTNRAASDTIRWSTGQVNGDTIEVDREGSYGGYFVNAFGCRGAADSVSVRILAEPPSTLATALTATVFCEGDSVVLAAVGAAPIRWSTGQTGGRITVREPGLYWAQGTSAPCPARVSDTITVTVNARPMAVAGLDQDLCEGDSVTLGQEPQPGTSYAWAPGDQLSTTNAGQTRLVAQSPNTAGDQPRDWTYALTATTDAGCRSTDSVRVRVHSRYELKADGLPYCPAVALLIPNLVTANGDGDNDAFEIKLLAYYRESTLEIYDRWGRQVYTAAPYRSDWTGTGLPAGTYYYRLRVPAPGWDVKGWVELAR